MAYQGVFGVCVAVTGLAVAFADEGSWAFQVASLITSLVGIVIMWRPMSQRYPDWRVDEKVLLNLLWSAFAALGCAALLALAAAFSGSGWLAFVPSGAIIAYTLIVWVAVYRQAVAQMRAARCQKVNPSR